MKKEVIMRLMFEYDDMSQEEIYEQARSLPSKILRWLGITHPDNNTRKIFYKLTNVEIGDDTVINRDFIINDNYKPLVKIGRRRCSARVGRWWLWACNAFTITLIFF